MGGYQNKQIVGFQAPPDELQRLMSRITFRVGKEVPRPAARDHVIITANLTGRGGADLSRSR